MNPIVWLMGLKGAGKTTTACALRHRLSGTVIVGGNRLMGAVVIDDEECAVAFGLNKYMAPEKSDYQIQLAKLAMTFSKFHVTIVASTVLTHELQEAITMIAHPVWFYLRVPYTDDLLEVPDKVITLNMRVMNTADAVQQILNQIKYGV